MLHIREETVDQFQKVGRDRLARDIVLQISTVNGLEEAHRYVDEAWTAGFQTDQEIAEFASLVSEADRHGRPKHIDDLIKDERTHSGLKLFQLRYALQGERP